MNTGRALLGTAFVSLGAVFLLDQAGVVDSGELIASWWPAILLVAAVLDLLARPARVISAGVFGALGIVLLGITTGVFDASVWSLVWPSAVILLGVWLIFRRGPAAGTRTQGESFDAVAVFSGRQITSTGRPFRSGSATAIFGGVEVDLTGAQLEPDAVLDAVALFGGVEVHVPAGWRILMDGPAIFGGNENKVPPPTDPDAPTLRVRATAIFGGVEVNAAPAPSPTMPGAAAPA